MSRLYPYALAFFLCGLVTCGRDATMHKTVTVTARVEALAPENCVPEVGDAVLNRLSSRFYPISTCDERTTPGQIACWTADMRKVRTWALTLKSACVAGQYDHWLNYYERDIEKCRQAMVTKKAPDDYESERKRREAVQLAWEARHPIPTPPNPEPCQQPR